MIRILYLIDDLMIGGAEKVLLQVVTGLEAGTFQCSVLTLFSADGMGDEFRNKGIPCENLGLTKSNRFRSLKKLRSRIRAGNYDIVQLIRPVSRIFGTFAMLGLRGPSVVSRYDSMASTERWWYRQLERIAIWRSQTIVAPSNAVMCDLKTMFNLANQRTVVVLNGIDSSFGASAAGTIRNGRLTIGTIGNVSWKKGYQDGLRAIRILKKSHPNMTYEIVGRENGRSALKDWIAELDLEDTVTVLGEQNDVSARMARWQVYFQPSVTEGFGLAILEAMSCGKAVVASNSGGIPELIGDRDNGILVESGNPQDMASALSDLLDDPKLAETLGANAKISAATNFNAERMIQEHECLYQELMKTRPVNK